MFELFPEKPITNEKVIITGISVQGYKSLYEESSIEIRPLTILAGANSSGKSSIMQPLLLMKQTLEAPYDPGALLINGANVKFTSANQLLSHITDEKHSDYLKITLHTSDISLANTYTKNPQKGFDISQVDFSIKGTTHLSYPSGLSQQDLVDFLIKYYGDDDSNLFESILSQGDIDKFLKEYFEQSKCFLIITIAAKTDGDIYTFFRSSRIIDPFILNLEKLIYLPGLRGFPERTYPTTATGQNFPGTFENYTASIISYWQETNDERVQILANYLEKLGLTSKIQATQINDVHVEIKVGRNLKSSTTDMINIADVGIGVSQVVPVLVALLVAEPGQLVYIEQPELHLHPKAQIALSEILADAARKGVKAVIETHSESLLLGIQSLIAEDKLDPHLVKLHWFTKGEDGITRINSADLDENGAFGDWPEDFGQIDLHLQNRYMTAVQKKLWEKSHDH